MDQTWSYNKASSPSAPVLEVELRGMRMECQVDTGFSGGLLIPFPAFEALGYLSRLGKVAYSVVLPDSSRIHLLSSSDEVKVGTWVLEADVHASPRLEKKLIGRRVLKAFVAELNGPEERLALRQG